MDYARKLRLCRKQLGLSQAAFGEMFGTTPMQVYRMESEKAKIPQNILDWIDEQKLADNPKEEVGHRIAELRKSMNMNRNRFAEYVGCSGSSISRIESGQNMIERTLAIKIADGCHVGVDWLLTGDEGKKDWPVNKTLTDFLWANADIREMLYRIMDERAGQTEDTPSE